MSLFPSPNAERTRVDLTREDLEKFNRGIDSQKVQDIMRVLDGDGLALLKARVIDRFASEITKEDVGSNKLDLIELNTGDAPSGFRVKKNSAVSLAIQSGMHTIASTFSFRRICQNRATLFNAQSEYSYDADGPWVQDFHDDRKRCRHGRRMSRLDLLSCGIGAAPLYVVADVRGYSYHPMSPSDIWVVHADEIMLDGIPATTDKTNIDDASVVVLRLGAKQYLAIMPKSHNYPMGRMVRYEAELWMDIPALRGGGYDYTLSGDVIQGASADEVANPLTLYRAETGGLSNVEVPVISWQMDSTADGTTVFPMSGTMLFDVLFDLDVEFSRDIESGGRSARGAWFGEDPHSMGFGKSISEGEHDLSRDQKVTMLSNPASNALQASQIISEAIEQAAGAYNVPSHRMATKDNIQVASGFALKILDQPLIQDRIMRAEINRAEMGRKFQIEKALLNLLTGKATIPVDADEEWTPGSINSLETPEEKRQQLDWEIKNGLKSLAEYYMETQGLDSKEAAMNMIADNKADNSAITPAPAAPAQAGGIMARFRPGVQ